jgi:hypothetical protein
VLQKLNTFDNTCGTLRRKNEKEIEERNADKILRSNGSLCVDIW